MKRFFLGLSLLLSGTLFAQTPIDASRRAIWTIYDGTSQVFHKHAEVLAQTDNSIYKTFILQLTAVRFPDAPSDRVAVVYGATEPDAFALGQLAKSALLGGQMTSEMFHLSATQTAQRDVNDAVLREYFLRDERFQVDRGIAFVIYAPVAPSP